MLKPTDKVRFAFVGRQKVSGSLLRGLAPFDDLIYVISWNDFPLIGWVVRVAG